MKISQTPSQRGFTLVEIMVSASAAVVIGVAAYSVGSATVKLFAENFSLNHTHQSARLPLDRIMREVHNSGCPPKLIDHNNADLPDNDIGPAAGIRYCIPASSTNYSVVEEVAANGTSVKLTVNAGQAAPRVSDLLVIHAGEGIQAGNPIQMEIIAVAGTSTPYPLTIRSAPGVIVPAGSSALLLQQGGFVVQAGELRYYNRAIAGATSFRVMAQLEAGAIPFSYDRDSDRATNDPGDPRLLRVNLRVRSGKYSNRVSSFNSFLNMRSTVAARSTYLEANNTVRSAYLDCARFNAIQ